MTELFVQYRENLVYSEYSNGEYGSWREIYDFRLFGVSLTSQQGFALEENLGCLVDVTAGELVFVLYMTYDTGNSCGHAKGKGEIIWVFKEPALAMKAKEKWEKENAKKDPEFSIEFEVDGGKFVEQYNPAAGYFENVGYVSVDTFLVNP